MMMMLMMKMTLSHLYSLLEVDVCVVPVTPHLVSAGRHQVVHLGHQSLGGRPGCLGRLDVAVGEIHPGLGDADVVVDPLHPGVEVDGLAGVVELVDGVVDVDPVVLVGQISLQLVPTVLVDPQLVVDGLQGLPHPGLALLDLVHLPGQGVLHAVTHQVDLLPALPVVETLAVHLHRALRLGQGLLQVPPGALQLVGEVDVQLQLVLDLRPPVDLVPQPLPDPPVGVPLGGHGLVLPLPDQPDGLVPDPLRVLPAGVRRVVVVDVAAHPVARGPPGAVARPGRHARPRAELGRSRSCQTAGREGGGSGITQAGGGAVTTQSDSQTVVQ